MGHIYARIAGFGLALMPEPGTRLVHGRAERNALTVFPAGGAAPIAIDPDELSERLSEQPTLVGPGLEAVALPGEPVWQIQTSPFSCPWPRSTELLIPDPPGQPSFFDLIMDDDTVLWVQGPFPSSRLPAIPSGFLADGRRLEEHAQVDGHTVVEVSYDLNETAWVHRYVVVNWTEHLVLVVTMQAPRSTADPARAAMRTVVSGLTPAVRDAATQRS